jgi:lysophospholipase L1-like esterase
MACAHATATDVAHTMENPLGRLLVLCLVVASASATAGCHQGTATQPGAGGAGGQGGTVGSGTGGVDLLDAHIPSKDGASSAGAGGSAGAAAGGSAGNATGGGPASGGIAGSGGALGSGGKTTGSGGVHASGGQPGGADGSASDANASDARGAGIRDAGTGGTGTGGSSGPDVGSSNVTVWLAGDSTMANGETPCPVGWGKQFQALFDANVKVNNSAQGGRSVQTWLYDVSSTMGTDGECTLNSTTYLSAWSTMLSGMKAGDYLFIQFGINDTDSACPRHVGTALFKSDFGMMAQAAKDRGAIPIFLTPVSSISCSGSTAKGSRGTFATATKEAGTTYNVTVIDLEQLSVALYNTLGFCPLPGADTSTTFESGAIGDFFCEDHTHFEAAGATQIAGLVAKALKDQGIGLAAHLK